VSSTGILRGRCNFGYKTHCLGMIKRHYETKGNNSVVNLGIMRIGYKIRSIACIDYKRSGGAGKAVNCDRVLGLYNIE